MKKKITAMILAVVTAMSMLSGCGSTAKTDTGVVYNTKYNDKSMVNINGEKVDVTADDVYLDDIGGFAFTVPEEWEHLNDPNGVYIEKIATGFYMFQYIAGGLGKQWDDYIYGVTDLSDDDAQALYDQVSANVHTLGMIYKYTSGDELSEKIEDYVASTPDFTFKDEIGTVGDNTYKLVFVSEVKEGDFSDADRADMQAMIDSAPIFRNNVILFTPYVQADKLEGCMQSFTTTDLDGNEVTQDIFKDYDITMINIWDTSCIYCVKETPALEMLYEGLPDNENLISICLDGLDNGETAKNLENQAGATFTTLCPDGDFKMKIKNFASTGTPCTFFVDSTGNVIGKVQSGIPTSDIENDQAIVEAYQKLIEEALGN